MTSPEKRDSLNASKSSEAERPGINFYVATLSGDPGTGTTATAELLSKVLGIKFTERGEIFKRWDRRFGEKTGVIGYAPRDVEVDKAMDRKTETIMRKSNDTRNPLLVESRLGGWIAKRLQDEGKIEAGPRILLTASDEIAAKRVQERESRKNASFNKTTEQVKADLAERRELDLEQWWKATPKMAGQNPMSPDFTYTNGERVYDIVINTDTLPVGQVVEIIYSQLLTRGYLKQRLR